MLVEALGLGGIVYFVNFVDISVSAQRFEI